MTGPRVSTVRRNRSTIGADAAGAVVGAVVGSTLEAAGSVGAVPDAGTVVGPAAAWQPTREAATRKQMRMRRGSMLHRARRATWCDQRRFEKRSGQAGA